MNGKNKIPILHLEDNKSDIVQMKGFLEEASIRYDYTQASSLSKGIELAHQQRIKLVLLDLNLTDSSGFKTCLLYTSPSPRDRTRSRMPSSA